MGSRDGHHVFFLDPFTKVRIWILNIPSNVIFHKMCFSSSPSSLDYMVIGFDINLGDLRVGVIKRGEEN